MRKILVTLLASISISSCGTTTNFSASSKGDIDELHASCVGPLGVFNINHEGEPIVQVSPGREDGNTEVYFSKHTDIESKNIVWPSEIVFSVNGGNLNVEESGEVGVNIAQNGVAYYRYPGTPEEFTINVGFIYMNQEKVQIEPITFKYETRKFLMCVQ